MYNTFVPSLRNSFQPFCNYLHKIWEYEEESWGKNTPQVQMLLNAKLYGQIHSPIEIFDLPYISKHFFYIIFTKLQRS